MSDDKTPIGFDQLNLSKPLLKAISDIGYEVPSPIQAKMIPHMLEGRDVIGQAQTGTGKTAAFAWPILDQIDLKQKDPQVMVLTPTRELAIQVAEAFQKYASHMKGFHVLPIYGGQSYTIQLRPLSRGVHVVVGTPGRVMDHIRKKSLKLNGLKTLVLDEADEMLRMGFIDDVEWILEQMPKQRQIALFSATMPKAIHKIAQNYLTNPAEIFIKEKTTTAKTIRQRYWKVSGLHKLDALTRILEAEDTDGIIIFVRTKNSTVELAEKLEARGYASAAINGDLVQKQRENTIDRLKKGRLDILVATDVAARGLDVPRISHVINYDIPHDVESYTHRIGRTGRAGRKGDAILFISPREQRMLKTIERHTHQPIEALELPTTEVINDKRIANFCQKITDTLAEEGLDFYQKILENYEQEHNIPALEIATALAKIAQGDTPLLLSKRPPKREIPSHERSSFNDRDHGSRRERGGDRDRKRKPRNDRGDSKPDEGQQRYRIEVGHNNGVKPGNIVGAIANEAGLDSADMGRIIISENYSTIDLPAGMPKSIFNDLKKVWVCNAQLNISILAEHAGSGGGERKPRRSNPSSDQDKRKPRRSKPSDDQGDKKPRRSAPSDSSDDKGESAPKKSSKRNADGSKNRKRKQKPTKKEKSLKSKRSD